MFKSDNFPKLTFGKAGWLQKLDTVLHTEQSMKIAGLTLYTKRKVAVDFVRSLNPLTRLVLASSCSEVKHEFQIGVNCCTKYSRLITCVCERNEFLKSLIVFIKVN
jgi:hypothetical protein